MNPLRELLAEHDPPDSEGSKDDRGTVVVVGGPPTCPGAALLTATAALRTGSGRVQLVVDPAAALAVGVAVPEALVTGWDLRSEVPGAIADQLAEADAVVIGPGHDRLPSEVVVAIVDGVQRGVVVLDAGALPAVCSVAPGARVVVAPNCSEAAALVGEGSEADQALRIAALRTQPVAVRGALTAVADGATVWVSEPAPPGLGTPGSGDVFAGVLGALLAGGLAPVGALGWATALHAEAGAILGRRTPTGYLAREIADQLPHALANVRVPDRSGGRDLR